MIPNVKILPEFILTIRLLRKTRRKIKCFIDNKGVYCCRPIDGTVSMKLIQTPSAPIKPHEDSDHHQLATWTLYWKRWNWTTEKLTTPSFDILDSVRINHLPNVCSPLIVSDKEDKSRVRSLNKVLQKKSVIIISVCNHKWGGNI